MTRYSNRHELLSRYSLVVLLGTVVITMYILFGFCFYLIMTTPSYYLWILLFGLMLCLQYTSYYYLKLLFEDDT